MKTPARFPCLPALLAALLTIGIVARGQDNNPTPPPAAPDAAQAQTAAPADATPAADAKTPPEKSELRRLDAEPAKTDAPSRPQAESSPAADQAAAAAPTPATPPVPEEATPPDHHKRPRVHHAHNGDNERVNFGGNSTLAAGESADAVISIFGSSTAEGDVGDAVVSVFGNSTSSGKVGNAVVSVLGSTHVAGGEVGDAAVSVLGTTTIDGQVHGPAVAVLGDVVLGPNASVGDVVCVGGTLKRDPAATVHGQINNVGFGVSFGGFDWLHAWVQHCLILGRPLAFGAHLMWAWWLALTMLALYVVIALLFPKGVEKCVRTFEERPGYSLLSALLVTLLTPLAAIVLLVTVVGTPALVLFLVIAGIFGKVVILAWMGRRVLKLFQQDAPAAALAVVVGGALLLLLYTVPFVGFIVAKLTSWVGLGAVVYTI
ncbi:MAG TPA: hypothetical protein VHE13_08835, partial [Opitutus sp.]|nr:hypothetical protein [Opitutus sp.]